MEPFAFKKKKNGRSKLLTVISLLLISTSAFAQQKTVLAKSTGIYSNPLFLAMVSIIILLLIAIYVFVDLAKAAADYKKEREKEKKGSSGFKTILVLLIMSTFSNSLLAQNAQSPVAGFKNSYGGLDGFTFYSLLTIIGFELLVLWILYKVSMNLLGIEERKRIAEEERQKSRKVVKEPSFIEKINASVAVEKEKDIMLDHNYDGIRELDNDLPPWWKYGFYVTIVFAVIYLIHFHITNTGKLQKAEYEDQMALAKLQMEEYQRKSADLVDENNATLLTDDASINSGKSVYMDNCAACHGRAGEGGVGPNLTDDYWLHSGSVKDIFKTIKYGYPEKGMKAWQQDLGAKQIHQVTSFIKSIQGTNPPNAKEKQGDLYLENGKAVSDSTQVAAGSL